MSRRTVATLALGAIAVFGIFLVGCSDNSGTTSSGTTGGDVTYYFPVTEGYTTVYEVSSAEGGSKTVSFEVGRQVPFGMSTAYEWYVTTNGNTETSYLLVDDSSVVFHENSRLPGEVILSLPLKPGSSWNRFTQTRQDTTSTETYYDNFWKNKLGGGEPGTYDGGINDGKSYQKLFPTEGSNQMTVDAVEGVSLSSGTMYSGSIRLRNTGPDGKSNYYWFAPGIGLVKYVIGAGDDYTTGESVGTLVSYGQ